MTRRFTRHSFNRAIRWRARRAAGDYCGIIVADERDFEPVRLPPVNLRDAPSSMEMRAAGWGGR